MTTYAVCWANAECIDGHLNGLDVSTSFITQNTSSAFRDADYSDYTVTADDSPVLGTILDAGQDLISDVWVHADSRMGSFNTTEDNNGGTPTIVFYDSTFNPQYRLVMTTYVSSNSSKYSLQNSTDGGTTWASLGAEFTLSANVLFTIDIHFKPDATTGVAECYVNGLNVLSFTGNTSTQDDAIRYIRIGSGFGNKDWSQMILADENTLNWKLQTLTANGGGTISQWSGVFSDINNGQWDGAHVAALHTNVLNQDITFDTEDIVAAASALVVDSVFVGVRGLLTTGATVTDVQGLLTVNGSQYPSAALGFPAGGGDYVAQAKFGKNPDNGSGWTQSDVNNLQIGVRSV